MKLGHASTLATLLIVFASATSSAASMQPGLWEVLTRPDSAGSPGASPPVSRVCFTEQDVARTLKTLPVPSPSCQSLNPVTGKDGTTSYDITCSGTPSMRGKANITTTAAAYEGTMKLSIKTAPDKPDAPLSFTFAGRRIGDCPAAAK